MTNAPSRRVVDVYTGTIAGEPDTEAAELDHLRVERDNALHEVERVTGLLVSAREEIAHLTALAAARSDQNRSDGLRAADKARKEKGLR